MQTTDNSAPAEVSTVAVRLPPFWAERPAVWFAQAEAQFALAGISSEQTKFYYVISQLERQYASEVEDIIISPPERDPYTMLKTELVKRLSPSKEERIHQLLALEMGDSKPSQFLRHLRSLAPEAPEDFLRTIWSSRLPPKVQAILAGQPEGNTLLHRIEDLSRQVAAISAELAHLRAKSRNPRSCTRNRRSGGRPSSRDDATSTLCWYHRCYGARAPKCTQPCSYRQQEKLTHRISAASH
jgi:hypothetical protein